MTQKSIRSCHKTKPSMWGKWGQATVGTFTCTPGRCRVGAPSARWHTGGKKEKVCECFRLHFVCLATRAPHSELRRLAQSSLIHHRHRSSSSSRKSSLSSLKSQSPVSSAWKLWETLRIHSHVTIASMLRASSTGFKLAIAHVQRVATVHPVPPVPALHMATMTMTS